MDILEKIYKKSKEDVAKRKREIFASEFRSMEGYGYERMSLYAALHRKSEDRVRILAEIKRASPSQGLIRQDFSPQNLATEYVESGAAALSVLTDEPFFQGHLSYLLDVAKLVDVPVLRKDFIHDTYQIEEAKAYGADAILLIATMLDPVHLRDLHHAAEDLGLECLVECYDEQDVDSIDFEMVRIFGVNNRDLRTFRVDVHRGTELLGRAPSGVVTVSESGLKTSADIKILHDAGVDAALIGEHFMRQSHIGTALREILNYS
jgi:indole-3-glycerol phosphate synthase